MRADGLAMLIALPLLAACAAGTPPPRSAGVAPPPAAPSVPRFALPGGPHVAQVHMAPGLEGVIGADAGQLIAAFGAPRLDVAEGDARKLQFSGIACVLDVYLYPGATRADTPRATYVAARRPSDGADTDRAACVAALLRKG